MKEGEKEGKAEGESRKRVSGGWRGREGVMNEGRKEGRCD